MTRKSMLVLAVLAMGIMTMPAYADVSSPLQQYKMGMPINEIQCSADKILMESPNGKPYCLSESTAKKLENRGFLLVVLNYDTKIKDSLSISDSVEIKLGITQTVNKIIEQATINPIIDKFEEKTTNFLDDTVVEIEPPEITIILKREIIYGNEGIGGTVTSSSDDSLYWYIVDSDGNSIVPYYQNLPRSGDMSKWSFQELQMSNNGNDYFGSTTNILSPGEYTIIVFNENTEIKKNFTIMDSKCCRPLSVNVAGGSFLPGAEIYLYVNAAPYTSLTFNLIDSDGKISKTKEIITNDEGTNKYETVTLSRIATPGIWTLEVTDGQNFDSISILVIPTPDELIKKSPTTKEIQISYDELLANKESKYDILLASSLEPFIDDGRERQIAILHRGGTPQFQYSYIMDSYKAGFDVNDKGVVTYVATPHEKYSLNPKQGFYLEDWLPEQIPDGLKLLYAGTGYYTEEINGNIYESYYASYTFVPSYFVLHENVTQYDLYYREGFSMHIGYSDLQDEIKDIIEESKDRFAETYKGYGGYQEMMRDGKLVLAFDGGHYYDHEHSRIFWIFDDKFNISLRSYYLTLDELITVFESIMK